MLNSQLGLYARQYIYMVYFTVFHCTVLAGLGILGNYLRHFPWGIISLLLSLFLHRWTIKSFNPEATPKTSNEGFRFLYIRLFAFIAGVTLGKGLEFLVSIRADRQQNVRTNLKVAALYTFVLYLCLTFAAVMGSRETFANLQHPIDFFYGAALAILLMDMVIFQARRVLRIGIWSFFLATIGSVLLHTEQLVLDVKNAEARGGKWNGMDYLQYSLNIFLGLIGLAFCVVMKILV